MCYDVLRILCTNYEHVQIYSINLMSKKTAESVYVERSMLHGSTKTNCLTNGVVHLHGASAPVAHVGLGICPLQRCCGTTRLKFEAIPQGSSN